MKHKNIILFIALSVACILLFLMDISLGSVRIPISNVFSVLFSNGENDITHEIILNIRLPKAITAIIAGVGLSLSGLMMQTLFRNPLAGPYILGVSSGATLGVATVMLVGSFAGIVIHSQWISIGAAIIGAALVLLLVVGVSHRVRNNVSLLIIGMMFGSISGAIVNVMQNYSNPDALKLFIVWTFGSLSSVSWTEMKILFPLSILGIVLAFAIIKQLNGLLLGENYACGLGINIQRTRLLIILSTGLLAGGITAFTGPIAFVGVAIPHIARGLFSTQNHRIVMPATALCGAALMLICDFLSQIFSYPLPISTVTSLFGAPIIIGIIVRKKQI